MVNHKQAGREPYVLVLGAGASLSSGCSSYSELVDNLLRQYCGDEFEKLNEEPDERAREETKRDRFYADWRRMTSVNRYAFLLQQLGGDPSIGYEHPKPPPVIDEDETQLVTWMAVDIGIDAELDSVPPAGQIRATATLSRT